MVQFIMDRSILLYAAAVFCAIGVISQLVLKRLYAGLTKDTRNLGEPESRYLQQLRQRFQYCSHLNDKVGNVQALIEKSIMEYKVLRLTLHQWKRIGLICLVCSLLCTMAGTAVTLQGGGNLIAGNSYFRMGILAVILTAIAYGIADTSYSRNCLMVRLMDYLENSGAVRDYSSGESKEDETGYEDENESDGTEQQSAQTSTGFPVLTLADSRRKSRKLRNEMAAAQLQSRAQKDKRELKENLSRIKTGMQEAAAEKEREKEKGADLLRQMDPKEQERIIREVLKEFLS